MKAKITLASLAILAVLAIGATVGCTKARNDAQIAGEVQNKIFSDAAVQSRQITIQSSNGVVTLSGYVGSDSERAAAASDAAQVEGVKTVVNNLQASSPTNAAAQPPLDQPAALDPPREEPAPASQARHDSARYRSTGVAPGQRRPSAYRNNSAPTNSGDQYAAAATPPPVVPVHNTPPPPPPVPTKVTVPDGTTFSVRLIDGVDSETAQPGQTFRASLDTPIVIDDNVVIPSGADVTGRVVDAKSAGRFAGKSALAVELFKLAYNGKTYNLRTSQYSREGTSRGGTTAKRVGTGAAIGAIIGGLAGGGKGAAIGATVGAGAGGGATAVHKGEQIKFNTEQVLVFTLESPLTVSPANSLERNSNRQTLDE